MNNIYKLIFVTLLFFVTIESKGQISQIDTLKQNLLVETNEIKRADLYIAIAKNYLNSNSWNDELVYYDSALFISYKNNYLKGIALASSGKGGCLMQKGDFDNARLLFEKSLLINISVKDSSEIGKCYRVLGFISYFQGRFTDGESQSNLALKYFTEIGDKKGQAKSIYTLASISLKKSEYSKALSYFIQSSKLYEEINDEASNATTLLGIGDVYESLKEHDESYTYTLKAIKIFEKNNRLSNLATAYTHIAILLRTQNKFDEALKYLELAIGIKKQLNEKFSMPSILNNKAIIYSELKKDSLALSTFYEALQINKELNDSSGIVSNLTNLAIVYGRLKDYKKAEEVSIEAINISKKNNYTINLSDLYLNLSDNDKLQGNYKQALENYELSILYRDSIFNQNNDKELLKIKTQFETETKENEIKILQADKKLKDIALFINIKTLKEQELISSQKTKDLILNVTQNKIKTLELENQQKENEKTSQQLIISKKESELRKLELHDAGTKQKLFALGIGVLLLFSGFAYNRYLQRKKLSEQLTQSLSDLKLAQAQLILIENEKQSEAIRIKISKDIHDDIGSNLTKITMLGNLISAQSKEKMPEITEKLERISDYARNVNNSMSEIIWAINPKQDTLENLLGYMRIHIVDFLKDTNINYEINFSENIPNIQLSPDLKRNLFLVLKESLNNSVKYSSAKNIKISFSLKNKHYIFTIVDDGFGFDTSINLNSKGGNGLTNLAFRMEQVSSTFSVDSSIGTGCAIQVEGRI